MPAAPATAQESHRLDPSTLRFQAQTVHDPASPEGQLQQARKAFAEGRADDAQDLAEEWIERYPNHPLQPEAVLLVADAKVARRNYYKALFDYEKILRLYPGSEQFSIALEREYQIADLFSHGMKRRLWGMRLVPAESEAEEVFIRIQERAPGSDVGEKASLALADHYFRHAEMANAAEAYDLFLLNYPRSLHREPAMLRLIQANLATFKGPTFDPTGLLDARQRLAMYQKEFPAAAERLGTPALLIRIDESMARKIYQTAWWYEVRGERVSAVYLHRRLIRDYPSTPAARDAMVKLTELGAPLAVATEETPAPSPAATPATAPATQPAPGEAKP